MKEDAPNLSRDLRLQGVERSGGIRWGRGILLETGVGGVGGGEWNEELLEGQPKGGILTGLYKKVKE